MKLFQFFKDMLLLYKEKQIRRHAVERANTERQRIVVLRSSNNDFAMHSMKTWKRLIKMGAFKPYKVTAEDIRKAAWLVVDPI